VLAADTDAEARTAIGALGTSDLAGIAPKAAARVRATGNVTLSAPGSTIDGVTMASGDRFLADRQSTASQDGIYVWNGASTAATRAADLDAGAHARNVYLFISEGTDADKGFVCTNNASADVVGTDGLTFTQFSAADLSAYAALAAANVFTARQTFRFESGNYAQARVCAAVRHRCSAVGQNFGAALAFESDEIGGAVVEMGYVRARRNDDHRWVELLPSRSNGTPPTAGLRCHCVGDVDAIYGVEAVVAASGGSPVLRPCVEGITTPDVNLTVAGLGAGGVRVGTRGTVIYDGTAQTTNDTVTTVWSATLADSTVYELEVVLVGRRATTAGRAVYRRRVVAYVESGSLTVETPDVIGTDFETTAGYDITIDASGTTLRVRATGDVGHTIRWNARVTLLSAST